MATGPASGTADSWLDALFNNISFAGGAIVGMKLPVGDPGAAGTANAASETTLQSVSFGSSAAGLIQNDAQIQWTSIASANPETISHFSLWNGTTGPGTDTFRGSGTVTANPINTGDTLTIAIGDLDISLTIAA